MYIYNQNRIYMNSKILGIKINHIFGVLLFYLFFMLSYYFALSYSFSDFKNDEPVYSYRNFIFQSVDYFLKFIVTIPIWFLIFRFFKKRHYGLDYYFML